MIEKYYTPTLEEFHVEFEYEIFQKGTPYDSKILTTFPVEENDTWLKSKYPDPFLGYNIEKILGIHKPRVKYLDKEDIESLGLKFKKEEYLVTDEYYRLVFKFSEIPYELDYYPNRNRIYIGNTETYEDHVTKFDGTIKNKSELVKLLKQLGI